jgi:hypothetical protein
MKSIAVYCGSSKGKNPVYAQAARELGIALANQKIKIVYGAGNVGLMGELADAALEQDGYVIGVIPYFLKEKEVCHTELSELHVVDSMDERKVKMAAFSEGTIILPGGYGTMDEMFELLTLVQLSQDRQPVGILNVNGYYDSLIRQVQVMYTEGFLKEIHLKMLLVSDEIDELLAKMHAFDLPDVGKWVDRKAKN